MNKDLYKNLKIYNFAKDIKAVFKENNNLTCTVFGNFGAYNLGDDSIMEGQLNQLKTFKNIRINIICRYPNIYTNREDFKSVGLLDIKSLLKSVFSSNFIILGGGGLFAYGTGTIRGIFFQIYFLLFLIFIPLLLNKKVYVLGIGFYENMNRLTSKLSLILIKFSEKVTVRDHHSYNFLLQHNIDVEIYKDNSYLMDLDSKFNIKTVFKDQYNKKFLNIGLALIQPRSELKKKQLINEIAKFMIKNKKNSTFWFYTLDNNPNYFSDLNFANQVIEKVKMVDRNVRYVIIPAELGPRNIFSSFKKMDYLIAMRFHSILFCYRNKINFFGIPYDLKCNSILEATGNKINKIDDLKNINFTKGFKL